MRQCPFCGVYFYPTAGVYHRHAGHGVIRGHPDAEVVTMETCWRCKTKDRQLTEEIVPLDQGDMYGAHGA